MYDATQVNGKGDSLTGDQPSGTDDAIIRLDRVRKEFGSFVAVREGLADDTELVTYVQSHAELPFLRPGEKIWVTWDPDSAYLVSGWPARAGATSTDVDQVEASL